MRDVIEPLMRDVIEPLMRDYTLPYGYNMITSIELYLKDYKETCFP